MYVAKFASASETLTIGAARYTPTRGILPPACVEVLTRQGEHDFSLRLEWSDHGVNGLVMVPSGSSWSQSNPADLIQRLTLQAGLADRFVPASDSSTFDDITGGIPDSQIASDFHGFLANGIPSVPEFRLLPQLIPFAAALHAPHQRILYQIAVMAYSPDRETIRLARKHCAKLEISADLPQPLRDLQISITRRLLEPGYLIEEAAAFSNPDAARSVLSKASQSFDSGMGAYGFTDLPVVEGSFDEFFLSGVHPIRQSTSCDFLQRAVRHITARELRSFLQTPLPIAGTDRNDRKTSLAAAADVFISYSSNDFPGAQLVVEHLESQGIGCWIAPRNVLPGEPYPEAIIKGIESARAVVVLVSQRSNISLHVHRELERALHRNLVLIPIRLENIRPTGTMEYLLSTCHRLDAFGDDCKFDEALRELTVRIQNLITVEGAPR